jgi:DNA polymerase I-like protein with 3'-5' exonuclease and polymerase domains
MMELEQKIKRNKVFVEVVDTPTRFSRMLADIEGHKEVCCDTETNGIEALNEWRTVYDYQKQVAKAESAYNMDQQIYKSIPGIKIKKGERARAKERRDMSLKKFKAMTKELKDLEGEALKNKGGLDVFNNRVGCVQIGVRNKTSFTAYLIDPSCIDRERLQRYLFSRETLYFHNFKFDYKIFKVHLGITIPHELVYDTQVAEYNIKMGRKWEGGKRISVALKSIVEGVLGEKASVSGRLDNWCTAKWSDEQKKYAALDVVYPFIVADHQGSSLAKTFNVFRYVDMPLTVSIAEMEMNGVCVDVKKLDEYLEVAGNELQRLHAIATEALDDINIDSNQQLLEKLNQKGHDLKNVDVDALTPLEGEPGISELMIYRKFKKLYGTYLVAIKEKMQFDGVNYKIHASFNATSSRGDKSAPDTGRLSSSEPNLQNQPSEPLLLNDYPLHLRSIYIPPKGWKMCGADQSQVELMVMADQSQEPKLIQIFNEGGDAHVKTAELVFGVPAEYECSQQHIGHGKPCKPGDLCLKWKQAYRTPAKTVNYLLIYGGTEVALGNNLGKSHRYCRDLKSLYFRQFPDLENWIKYTHELAHRNGYVSTVGGRIRWLDGINSDKEWLRAKCERQAVSTRIQGTCAEGMRTSINLVQACIQESGWDAHCKQNLNVHDEGWVAFDPSRIDGEKVRDMMDYCMTQGLQQYCTNVIIKVGSADNGYRSQIVDNWGEFK